MDALKSHIDDRSRRTRRAQTVQFRDAARTKTRGTASTLSRRLLFEADAELCNAALVRFIDLLYDADASGTLWNVSAVGKIERATPWSSKGHKEYALTDPLYRVFRIALVERLTGDRFDLLMYVPEYRSWFLNFRAYKTREDAERWIAQNRLTADGLHAARRVYDRRVQKRKTAR